MNKETGKSRPEGVKKNYIYHLSYQLLTAVFPLVTTPYVARVLGAEGTGAYSFTVSIVTYFCLAGNLGVATYGQLQTAGSRDDRKEISVLFCELETLKLILTAAVVSIYCILVVLTRPQWTFLFLVLSLQIIANAFDIAWFFQGLEQFRKIFIRNFLTKLIGTILIFTLVRERKDIYLYAFLICATALAGNLSMWFFLFQAIDRVPIRKLRPFRHLRSCVVYFVPTIATTIYLTVDKSMLGWITGGTLENGYYEQAQKIEHMAATVVTSVSVVAMPGMAYFRKTGDDVRFRLRLQKTIHFVLLVALPMCFGICLVADQFVPLFLGPGYQPSVALLRVLSTLLIIIGLNNAVGKQVLMAGGRQKEYNRGVFSGLAVNVVLNAVLIYWFGASGAAIASVFAEMAVLLTFLVFSRDYICVRDILRSSRKSFASVLMMSAAVAAIRRFTGNTWRSLGAEVLIGIAAYVIGLYFLREEMLIGICGRLMKG